MPFSFLNIAFLAGLAAAAIPILIHLFSRRKVARIPFSSIQFLEEIARRRVRRMRLTQWIILALRVLALALLAIALGRPAFRGDFVLGKSRGDSAVVIVLDRSYSMQVEGERETLWERAKARALEVLEAVESEDRVVVIGVDPRVDAVDAFPGRQAAVDAVRGLDAGFGATDFPSALRRSATALASGPALNKELFLISDFQRSGGGGGDEGAPSDLLTSIGSDVRVFLIPVDEGPIPNNALVEARLEGSAVDQRTHILAERFAPLAADEVAVTVESGPEVVGEGRISLLPQAQEAAEIPLSRLPGEGEELLARLSRDRLAVDDLRYVPSIGTGRVTTWVVQDPAQASPFLPLALSPGDNVGRLEVTRVPSDGLATADLSDVQLIVLDNVSVISREALMRLREWRRAGGALFIALGDRVDLRYYNESVLPALFPGVTLGNLLGTDEATGSTFSLTPRAPGHPAFAGFEPQVGQPITGATFWRVVEVNVGKGVRTLAEFGPGLPALVEGDGAILFASSLDGRWNNFVTHAAFLPLLHQSLDAVLREGNVDRVVVGEPVQGVVDRSLVPTGAELLCTGPDGLELAVTSRPVSRGLELRSAPAPRPGFYAIQAAGRVLVRRAVNVDAEKEADLTPMPAEELAQAFSGPKVRIIRADESVGTPVREARYGREFWRELVVVVLLLLITEGWLSRRGVA